MPHDQDVPRRRLSPEMASFRLLVLAAVSEYFHANGSSPSYGEIAAALASNRKRVRKAVLSLVDEGLLLRTPGPRGLQLPGVRDQAIRQLRDLGWTVDEDLHQLVPPGAGVTDRTLLPPPELTYPARGSIEAGDEDGQQAA